MPVYIDLKSGKAEPWAALQLCGYSLCNSFDVEFDEATHIYKYKGNILPSVTGILKAEGFIDDTWYTDWAREKGQFVHQAVEYDIADCLIEESVDETVRPYLSAFRKFMKESGFKVERSEIPQLSTTYHYAGKSDLYGCFPKPTAARRFALELNNEGKYKLISYKDQNDFPVWLAAVAVHHWKRNHKKGR